MHFNNALVRELSWCIGSTPLLQARTSGINYQTLDERWFRAEFEACLPWLEALDDNPKLLQEFMTANPTRLLGKRFELLVRFWLEHSGRFELVTHSHQLMTEEKTVGEVDFVYKELDSGRMIHAEVACKFYLSFNHSKAWKNWKGPNANDTLELKMDKLDQQLRVLELPEGQAWMASLALPKPEPTLMLKGYLFHHFTTIFTPKHPTHASPGYPSGFWLWLRECGEFFGKGSHWVLLPKQAWLAPYQGHSDQDVLDHVAIRAAVAKAIHTYHRGIMLVSVDAVDGVWHERMRGMVVPNVWPGK